jgi:ABC-type phosphate/phosphonate transport system substrate-binding protein
VWAVVPVVVALGVPRAGAADAALKIGLPETMFHGMPAAIVQPASRPFQSLFEKQSGFTCEVTTAKDHADLAAQIAKGKVDIAVFHGFEYAWVRDQKDIVPLLVTVPRTKHRACLVVNVESKAANAASLTGECVAVPATTKAHCRLYLERLKGGLPAGCCDEAKFDGKTISVEEALDAVATNKCGAALVDASALASYQTDKPGAGKQLKVLSESDAFPAGVIAYRKGAIDPATADKIAAGLTRGVKTAQGQLLTSLWRLEGFAPMTPDFQAELDKCLKAYPAPKK